MVRFKNRCVTALDKMEGIQKKIPTAEEIIERFPKDPESQLKALLLGVKNLDIESGKEVNLSNICSNLPLENKVKIVGILYNALYDLY